MKLIPIQLSAAIFAGLCLPSSAADPTWWAARGVTTPAAPSNLSPATTGQAKHLVAMALAELRTRLEPAFYQTLRSDIAAITDLTTPTTQAGFEQQRKVLLIGQLKALADPFYRRLNTTAPVWLAGQRGDNQTQDAANPSQIFPWTSATGDDSNKGVATLGQLKAVFALKFETLGFDADGLTEAQELALGTSSVLTDTDGDGMSDSVDFFPLDPSRSAAPSSTSGDVTKPLVTLIAPGSATYLTGP